MKFSITFLLTTFILVIINGKFLKIRNLGGEEVKNYNKGKFDLDFEVQNKNEKTELDINISVDGVLESEINNKSNLGK